MCSRQSDTAVTVWTGQSGVDGDLVHTFFVTCQHDLSKNIYVLRKIQEVPQDNQRLDIFLQK